MFKKAEGHDFPGRFREIIGDPLNMLIQRDPMAGMIVENMVVLHNGHRVPLNGESSYYAGFSEILRLNRGVHEPVEEFAFQEMIPHLPQDPTMLELGAYWAHYSMWLKLKRPKATTIMVESEKANLAAGEANFERHSYQGRFILDFVGQDGFSVDRYLSDAGLESLTILHSDIQGFEVEMLQGAKHALSEQRIGYLFVSTHSQDLHLSVGEILSTYGYRIELSSDFEHDTTSYDGFILAVHPGLVPVFRGPPPLGREQIVASTPDAILRRLQEICAG